MSVDSKGFYLFTLMENAQVGMLDQLGKEERTGVCVVNLTLLSKLPHDLRPQCKRFITPICTPILTLLDISEWLEYEVHISR